MSDLLLFGLSLSSTVNLNGNVLSGPAVYNGRTLNFNVDLRSVAAVAEEDNGTLIIFGNITLWFDILYDVVVAVWNQTHI